MSATDDLIDALNERTIDLFRYDAATRREMVGAFEKLYGEIRVLLDEIEPDTVQTRRRVAKLRKVLKQVEAVIDDFYLGVEERRRRELAELARLQQAFAAKDANRSIKVDAFNPAAITTEQARALVDRTVIEGGPMGEWWKRQRGLAKQRIADAIRLGYMLGENPRVVARRVRGALDLSRRNAEAITRTAMLGVSNSARMETYKQHEKYFKGYRALVTFDERTSAICMARAGATWDLEGNPTGDNKQPWWGAPPWHWNCRSTLVPVFKSFEEVLGIRGLPEPPEGARQSMDGLVGEHLTYEDWLRTKSVDFQRRVLGPGRFELWEAGRLKLADLVDQTGRELTLEELKNR